MEQKKYDRVIQTYYLVLRYALIIGLVETAAFWLVPNQILRVFGNGDTGYVDFALRYMHEFFLLLILGGIPPISMNVMSSVGKAKRGIMISLSKQLALILLLLILPHFLGIDGVLYSGPLADIIAAAGSWLVLKKEFGRLRELQESGS